MPHRVVSTLHFFSLMLSFSPSSDLSMDTLVYLAYRLASYLTLNLGEDAAVLAFMFC